jgi:protocatechuate 3,4-dioxygenase beta subunit
VASGGTSLIHGRVLDARGRPVAGARIAWVSGPLALPDVALLTDAQGRFTLAAPQPGRYELRADSDTGSATAVVLAAGAPLTLALQLVR